MSETKDIGVSPEISALLEAAKPEKRSGKATSEFWITAVVQILAIILMAYGCYRGNDVLVGIGAALSGGSGSVYAGMRTSLKKRMAEVVDPPLLMPGPPGS